MPDLASVDTHVSITLPCLLVVCLFAAAVYLHTYYVYTYSMMPVHYYTAFTYSTISFLCALVSQALCACIYISLFHLLVTFTLFITQRGAMATVYKP
jgi:hypothetical protein